MNKILIVKSANLMEFFLNWFQYLKPYHGLTNREIRTLASIYKHKYLLSKEVENPAEVDSRVLSKEYSDIISKETGLGYKHLKVSISVIRKRKIIVDKRIDIRLMPNIEGNEYNLQLKFKVDDTEGIKEVRNKG